MDFTIFYDSLYEVSHYAPLVIFIATVLDIFFITGYIFYGAAMLSSVLALHMSGMIGTEALLVVAFFGTVIGNSVNYWVGRLFGQTAFVQKRLQHPRAQKAEGFLRTRGLTLYMVIGRFITFTRPLYALILGSMSIRFDRFLIREIPLAFFWVSFWLLVILQGEELWLRFTT